MKRTAAQADGGLLVAVPPGAKRSKGVENAVSLVEERRNEIISAAPVRTSELRAPIMKLEGHGAEILTSRFNYQGNALASGSFDQQILLWNVYGECDNFQMISGHKGAITELEWMRDDARLVTSSSDKTVGLWDVDAGVRLRKLVGHRGVVNSCGSPHRSGDGDEHMIVSGSDDGCARVWDVRQKKVVMEITCPSVVTAVCCGSLGQQMFTGGLDNNVTCWDLRNESTSLYKLEGHDDTITSLRLSPDGSTILTNSMDNSIRTWSAKPFSAGRRQLKIFTGAVHGFEKRLLRANWSPDGRRIVSGSSDHQVYVWDVASQRILYRLPGHKGSVNEVDYHPTEPVIVSGSSDKSMFLGEIVPTKR